LLGAREQALRRAHPHPDPVSHVGDAQDRAVVFDQVHGVVGEAGGRVYQVRSVKAGQDRGWYRPAGQGSAQQGGQAAR
jgi:hypothetical protein